MVPSQIPIRHNQILINIWYGIPYKKVGKYVEGFSEKPFTRVSCTMSHSKYYTDIVIRDSFKYSGEILECGVPRNDVFFLNRVKSISEKIKKYYKVENKSVLLYAPTFRGNFENVTIDADFRRLLYILKKKFGNEWVVFHRVHPLLVSIYKNGGYDVVDVSKHGDIQELLHTADLLITDYSSSMWDYSLL